MKEGGEKVYLFKKFKKYGVKSVLWAKRPMPKAQMGQDLLRLAGEVVWGRKSLAPRDP